MRQPAGESAHHPGGRCRAAHAAGAVLPGAERAGHLRRFNREPVTGLERFSDLVGGKPPLPLSLVEQQMTGECSAEVSIA